MNFIDELCFRVAVIGPAHQSWEIVTNRKTLYSPTAEKLASIDPNTEMRVEVSMRVVKKQFYDRNIIMFRPADRGEVDVINITIMIVAHPCVRTGICAGRVAYYDIESLIHDVIPTIIPPRTRFEFTMPLHDCHRLTSIAFLFKLVDEPQLHFKYAGMSRE